MGLQKYILKENWNFPIVDKGYTLEELRKAWDNLFVTGYKDIENGQKFVYKRMNQSFPHGYKDIPNVATFYRVLFLSKNKRFKKNELGKHWVSNPEIMDHWWIDSLMGDLGYTEDDVQRIVVIKAEIDTKQYLNVTKTVEHNAMFPYEQEWTMEPELKTNDYKIYLYKEFAEEFNIFNPYDPDKMS